MYRGPLVGLAVAVNRRSLRNLKIVAQILDSSTTKFAIYVGLPKLDTAAISITPAKRNAYDWHNE